MISTILRIFIVNRRSRDLFEALVSQLPNDVQDSNPHLNFYRYAISKIKGLQLAFKTSTCKCARSKISFKTQIGRVNCANVFVRFASLSGRYKTESLSYGGKH